MTTTDRRHGVNAGQAIKVPCRVATTAAITLSGTQTIDGVAVVAGDRVLVKNQASSVDNGIYVVDSSAWDRALDFDGTLDVVTGTLVFVYSGSATIGWWYVSTVDAQIVPGTDAIDFSMASASLAVVSVFAQTLLDDTTLLAARTTLLLENTATKSAGFTVDASHLATTFDCTSSWTMALTAAATLGDGFFFRVRNSGTGVITIDPNGVEVIDGATTLAIFPNESCLVMCSGASFSTIGLQRASQRIVYFQKDMATGGTQQVRGVGFKPRAVCFIGALDAASRASWGFDNGSSERNVMYDDHNTSADTWKIITSGTYSIYIAAAGNDFGGSISALDNDGFDILWVRSGTPTTTCTVIALCLR